MVSLRRVVGGCAVAAAIGCGPVVDGSDGGGGSDESTDGGGQSVTMTGASTVATSASTTATATDPTATDPTATATASATATMSTSATMSATDPTDPTGATMTSIGSDSDTDGHGDLPNGSMCADSIECASDHCFLVGVLGGICGECEVDGDCPDGGCTLPQVLAQPPVGSVCNDGGYAEGCMSDDACANGLQCAVTIDVPGVITVATCGECGGDADCDTGFVCAPDIAIAALNGVKRCVAEGTLANGQSCDWATSGDVSCSSGHCAIADVMGFVQIGVCSSCEVDMDCADGQFCNPPQADINAGLTPGACG